MRRKEQSEQTKRGASFDTHIFHNVLQKSSLHIEFEKPSLDSRSHYSDIYLLFLRIQTEIIHNFGTENIAIHKKYEVEVEILWINC